MTEKKPISVSHEIAYLENEDATELFLKAIGFDGAVPQQSGNTYPDVICISFTDERGAGHTATYSVNENEYGVCEIVDLHVHYDSGFNQPPINQHDLLMKLLELEKDDRIETKRQMSNAIIEFMRDYC